MALKIPPNLLQKGGIFSVQVLAVTPLWQRGGRGDLYGLKYKNICNAVHGNEPKVNS
jgi:hypothetical protein